MTPINNQLIQNILSEWFNCELWEADKGVMVEFYEIETGPQLIKVLISTESAVKGRAGIHIHSIQTVDELQTELRNAIESALKDGFETIWIHDSSLEVPK